MTAKQIRKISELIDVRYLEISSGEMWSKSAKPDTKFRIDYDLELIGIEVPNNTSYKVPDNITFVSFENIIRLEGPVRS